MDNLFRKIVNNPYKKLTDQEKEELQKIEESVKQNVRAFSQVAKALYDDHRYKKLKNEFKRIYEQNLNLIIYFNSDDPNKYLMKMREFQIQLRVLKSIFDTPEGFIRQEEALDK